MKAIILAGGKGKRLAPYTTILPKPLMPLGDMSIIEIVIRQLSYYGIKEITLAVGYLSELIMAFCSDGKKFGTTIHYSYEKEALGTAGPLSLVNKPSEAFLVMNGDILTSINYKELISYHNKSNNLATVATYERDERIDFGVIKSDSNNQVIEYIEKPINHYNVSTGIYIFEPKVYDYIKVGVHMNLPDLIKILIDNKQKVSCYNLNGHWLDIGRKDDYEVAIQKFGANRSEFLPPINSNL